MSRKRWVYTEGGVPLPEPVEVGQEWKNHIGPSLRSEAEIYGNLMATDGKTPLDSRRKHRDFMAAHGLAMYDDFTETRAKAAKERQAMLSGDHPEYQRKLTEDIQRAYQQCSERPRRR